MRIKRIFHYFSFLNKSLWKYHFSEPHGLTDVAAFHDLFSMPVVVSQTYLIKSGQLRIDYYRKELKNWSQPSKTMVERWKYKMLMWFTICALGAVLEFGLASIQTTFDEVQTSVSKHVILIWKQRCWPKIITKEQRYAFLSSWRKMANIWFIAAKMIRSWNLYRACWFEGIIITQIK